MHRLFNYLLIFVLAATAWAQDIHTFGALDTNNTWTGSNAFQAISSTAITDSGLLPGRCVQTTSGGLLTVASTACATGIQLQTNGVANSLQSLLNLTNGTGITITDGGLGVITIASSLTLPTFQTNGVNNGSQTLLNLAAGANMTLTDNGSGTITFASSGGGGGGITGSGTNNKWVKWTSSSTVGDSRVTEGSNTYSFASQNNGTLVLGPASMSVTSPVGDFAMSFPNTSGTGVGYTITAQGSTGTNPGGIVSMVGGFSSNGSTTGALVEAGNGSGTVGGTVFLAPGTGSTRAGVVAVSDTGTGSTVPAYFYPDGITFANLGTPSTSNPNGGKGAAVYCTDCTPASSPCTGSGTGTWAFWMGSSAWKCF